MVRTGIAIVCAVLLGALLAYISALPGSQAAHATPRPAPAVISSEVLGRANPADVADPELALGRVTIIPGGVIPVHHHPGTQIGVVVQGTLTYTVITATVDWIQANHREGQPYAISAGETVDIPTGDALVEAPGSIHQGRNDASVPVVIYLSTLFPTGAPRAILDDATPTP